MRQINDSSIAKGTTINSKAYVNRENKNPNKYTRTQVDRSFSKFDVSAPIVSVWQRSRNATLNQSLVRLHGDTFIM